MKQVCLRWQNRYDADVNMLLFAHWQATKNIRLSTLDIENLVEKVALWRAEILLPLRSARKGLADFRSAATGKEYAQVSQLNHMYQEILQQELEAEFVQQRMMAESPLKNSQISDGSILALTKHNLAAYLSVQGLPVQGTKQPLKELASILSNVS